jgi:hypothetical protein
MGRMWVRCLGAALLAAAPHGATAESWAGTWTNSTRTVTARAGESEAASNEQDRAARARLRQAVVLLENDQISREQFEGLVPRNNVARWQRLQRQIPVPRAGSADLAFVLAYYGVEYPLNLERLLQPYREWRYLSSRHREGVRVEPGTAVQTLPRDLEILFGKHQDALSLGGLLTLQLPSGPSQIEPGSSADEAQMAALHRLWINHAAMLLRVAGAAPARMRNLARSLAVANDNTYDREEVLGELHDLSQHNDSVAAQAAEKVRSRLLVIYSTCPSLSR